MVNLREFKFLNLNQTSDGVKFIDGQVGLISVKNQCVIICSNLGEVGRYRINDSTVYPADIEKIDWIKGKETPKLDSAVVAGSFDD